MIDLLNQVSGYPGAVHEVVYRFLVDASGLKKKQRKGKAFLKALVGLCRDLGVETIAEMVDDEKGLRFIRECGVQYVQGYLFGKPNTNIKSFDKLRLPSLFPQWRG